MSRKGPFIATRSRGRIASLFGKERSGPRIAEAVAQGLSLLQARAPDLLCEGEFWFTKAQRDSPPTRDRSAAHASLRKADRIAPIEIKAAIEIVREQNDGLGDAELAAAAAQLLGFQKAKPDLRELVLSLVRMARV